MKPGRVVTLRINPADCISCVDVVDKLEVYTDGMSFDQVVRIALSSLLESVRQNGVIPIREGFEFLERVDTRFKTRNRADRSRKLAITRLIDKLGPKFQPEPLVPGQTPEKAALRRKFEALDFRFESDPINFSAEDKAELESLAKQLTT